MKRIGPVLFITLLILLLVSGCISNQSNNHGEDTNPPQTSKPVSGLTYPFENKNMFFGLTMLALKENPKDRAIAEDLDISWVSLQPHLLWLAIEKEPGVYDWSSVDEEVLWLQSMDIDITMVVSPTINAFGEQRTVIENLLIEKIESGQYTDASSALISLLRDDKISTKYDLYPHDETLPLFLDFVKAAVERYDGDDKDDMPGLKYVVRNWHFIEEYPTCLPGLMLKHMLKY
ncbi:MAG: hypothetical protein ACXQTP_00875 [Candidatus Methanofastidiosia archaeon]